MEPKPKITWNQHTNGVWFLIPPFEVSWPDYTIAIYHPYNNETLPYHAVADYWSDDSVTLCITNDLEQAKREAEQYWFYQYVNR